MATNAMNGCICTSSTLSCSYTNLPDGHSFRRRLLTVYQVVSLRSFTAYRFCAQGRLQTASKPTTAIHPTTVASPSPLANEFQEPEESSSNTVICSSEDEAVFRKQNARSLALLNSSSSPKTFETAQEDNALFEDEEVRLTMALDKDDVTRTPRFPGSVSSARTSRVEQLLIQGKGRSDWEEQMLRQALSIRRLRTKEVLKEAMKSSELSDRYSENLVSHMDGFVDYIIIGAASSKSNSEFSTSTFTARAKFCIRQSGIVELVKWLKHNQLSYPRIGMLVSTVADDLEGLKLRIRWLKSIHVRGRYLGVVLTRQANILRRPIEDLDDNVQFLESHGVLIDWMGFVVSRCPEILSFSMEELKCRVNFFLELGMSDNDFGTMVFEYPKAIGFFSIADMINKVKYLKEFGIDNRDLGRLISLRPRLLACNVEEEWKPLVKYLFYLGVQRSGMRRLLIKEPSIFLLNLRYNIAPKVRFLRAIGIYDEAVGEVLVKFPKLLTYSLDKKIRPVVKFLIERSGVPEADIGKVIASEPELIGCSISGKLEVTTKYFLALGIPPQMLGRMIADFPMLLKYNLSVIRPKFRYLKRVMVRPLLDLIEFPRFFSYSLSSRIIPRHEVLVENAINFPLRYMLAPSDEEFSRRVEAALSSRHLEIGDVDVSGTLGDGLQSSNKRHDFVPLEEAK